MPTSRATSPPCNAIAATGNPAGVYDQRGSNRVNGSTCSIGAFEPGPINTTTALSANPSSGGPFGTSVTFTATVAGVLGGTPPDAMNAVTFTNGATTLGTGTLTGGVATFTTTTLPPGNSVTATYAGGGNYGASPASNAVMVPITTVACVVTTASDTAMHTGFSLRDAVNAANAGGCTNSNTITFDTAGTFATIQTITLTGVLNLTAAMTITGPGASKLTVQGKDTMTDAIDLLIQGGNANAVTVSGVTVSGAGRGFGVDIGRALSVTNSTFSGNQYGIVNNDTANVTNSTLSGNQYGLFTLDGIMTVTNSTLTGNTNAGIANAATANVTNSLIVNNGTDVNGSLNTDSHNLRGIFAFADSAPTVHAPGATATLALPPGSPAIGAGDPVVCANTMGTAPVGGKDQRGVIRPVMSCDIGAFQTQGFTFSMPTGTPQTTAKGLAFPTPLGLTVTSSAGDPVNNGTVTFTGPSMGAGITGSPITATITTTGPEATSGTVSQSVTANGTAGRFTVTASTAGAPVAGNLTYTLAISTSVTTITHTIPAATLTNATSVSYTVTFADPLSGLTASDFTLTTTGGITGASVSMVTGSGMTWTVTVNTGTGDGTLRLDFTGAANDVSAPVSNAPFTTGDVYTIDKTPPTLTTLPSPLPTALVGQAYSATFTANDPHASVITVPTGLPASFTFTPGTMANIATLTGTPTSAGTIMFTVQAQDGAGNSVIQPYTITVNAVQVTGLTVTAPTGMGSGNSGTASMPKLPPGQSLTLSVVGSYNNGMMGSISGVTYMSSDPTKVSVDANGKVTGIAPGTATITVMAPNGVTTITVTVASVATGGLTNPNMQPMTRATAAPAMATPVPQPGTHLTSGSGVQPQAAVTPTATPNAQPTRH